MITIGTVFSDGFEFTVQDSNGDPFTGLGYLSMDNSNEIATLYNRATGVFFCPWASPATSPHPLWQDTLSNHTGIMFNAVVPSGAGLVLAGIERLEYDNNEIPYPPDPATNPVARYGDLTGHLAVMPYAYQTERYIRTSLPGDFTDVPTIYNRAVTQIPSTLLPIYGANIPPQLDDITSEVSGVLPLGSFAYNTVHDNIFGIDLNHSTDNADLLAVLVVRRHSYLSVVNTPQPLRTRELPGGRFVLSITGASEQKLIALPRSMRPKKTTPAREYTQFRAPGGSVIHVDGDGGLEPDVFELAGTTSTWTMEDHINEYLFYKTLCATCDFKLYWIYEGPDWPTRDYVTFYNDPVYGGFGDIWTTSRKVLLLNLATFPHVQVTPRDQSNYNDWLFTFYPKNRHWERLNGLVVGPIR